MAVALVRAGRIVGTGMAAALLLAGCYYYRGEGPPANYEFRSDAPPASESPFAKTEVKAPGPPPPPREETQTPKPSDYAVWVPGEWRYQRNQWVWWAGRWDAQPLAKEWQPGGWEQSRRDDSWEYRPGGWIGGPEDLLALAALEWLAPSRPPPPLRRVRPVRPSGYARHRWINGYWAWHLNDWAWVEGYWGLPPRPSCVWSAVTWVVDGDGWVSRAPGWRC